MPNRTPAYDQLLEACQPYGASLVAVSKTRTIPEMIELYDQGQRVFAENKVQEIITKAPLMPKDVKWHLIGHLQTNKVKSILPVVSCIQSMDSERLWEKINEEAIKLNKTIDVLLQIKIAQEESKYGWDKDELLKVIHSGQPTFWTNVNVRGVMGMATLTDDQVQVRNEMRQLKLYYDQLKSTVYATLPGFNIISMGMSGDYKIALEEGSNMVRIGTALFE